MNPVTDHDGDVVRVLFAEEQVGFLFDEWRHGGEHARVAVHHLGLDGQPNGRIQRAELKLEGLRARDEYVKRLDSIADEIGYDWRRLVDLACESAKDAWRSGKPAQWLDVSQVPRPVEFAIDRVLLRNKVNIWFGAGGIGKGYLLVHAAVSVSHGRHFLGLAVRPGRVMYLDWEDEDDDLVRRIREVSAGLGLEPRSVLYQRQYRPLRHLVDGVVAQVRKEQIALVIIDSATGAGGEMDGEHGYEQVAQQLLAACARITAAGATVLMNDHTSGASRGGGRDLAGRPYGSVRKTDLARAMWEIKREEAVEGGTTRLAMIHQKHNHTERFPSIGVEVVHTAGMVRFGTFDVRESATLASGASLLSRMRYELRQGPLDLHDWAKRVEAKEDTVYKQALRHPEQFLCQEKGSRGNPSRWALFSDNSDTL